MSRRTVPGLPLGVIPSPIRQSARILAIDLGTTTGWAMAENGSISSGEQDFHRYAGSKSRPAEHVGQPFVSFHDWLLGVVSERRPEAICYEEVYRWNGAAAARAFGAYRGMMLYAAAKAGIPCVPYSPSEIKRFMTNNGNASKEMVIAAVKRRFPSLAPDEIDNNRADALAILLLHLSAGKKAAA